VFGVTVVRKGYLDPNIINWARRAEWPGEVLRGRLADRGVLPHFGIHGVYELTRAFLSGQSNSEAQVNFQILAELDPVFEPTPAHVYKKEVDCFRTRALVIPVLDQLDHVSAKQQVLLMASGKLEEEGRKFVVAREENVRRSQPEVAGQNLNCMRTAVADGERRPKTLEHAMERFEGQIPRIVQQALLPCGLLLSDSEARAIGSRLDEFLAIRSTVRANIYTWAILFKDDRDTSSDKDDDFRHVIEASYCDVFVTGDRQLTKAVPRLHTGLQVLTWTALSTAHSDRLM
jgi:hypothetical protein